MYLNVMDYLQSNAAEHNIDCGRMIILPSSFQGSPQNMQSHYQDAMAIVMAKGKPDLFITFTCNPNWPEISNNLANGEKANFRPDLVS